jgi:glycosyltransferase involved in cell wall biosynthesis
MRILYAIQNVGGIDFNNDLGDTVPIKYTLRGLTQNNHIVKCIQLDGSNVRQYSEITGFSHSSFARLGASGKRGFRVLEGAIRRLQRGLGISYYAFFDSFRFYEAARRILPEVDLCHEHNGLFCLGGAFACARSKKPYVLTFSADPILERKLVKRPLRGIHAQVANQEARYAFRIARKIICVSEQAKQQLVRNWSVDSEKIVVMPNGVDVHLFGRSYDPLPVRARFGFTNHPIIGFVGGFQPWHGTDLLVDAFASLVPQQPNLRLFLVGDGPARPMIEKQVNQLGLSAKVVFTGLVPQSQVPEMLSIMDVAVIPYPKLPNELWFSPLKLYEYMAAGKAIVASQSGQIAEVLQNGYNGILVEPGNLVALSEAINKLIIDPQLRIQLGKNAQHQAVERHSWEKYIQRLEAIYKSVLDFPPKNNV